MLWQYFPLILAYCLIYLFQYYYPSLLALLLLYNLVLLRHLKLYRLCLDIRSSHNGFAIIDKIEQITIKVFVLSSNIKSGKKIITTVNKTITEKNQINSNLLKDFIKFINLFFFCIITPFVVLV